MKTKQVKLDKHIFNRFDTYLWSTCILPFLNARDVQRFFWVNQDALLCQTSISLDWTQLLLQDTLHIRNNTRIALQHYYEHHHATKKPLDLSTIISIYTHPTSIRIYKGATTMHEIGFYHSTFQSRGICWSTNYEVCWYDAFTKETTTKSFDWLHSPPSELKSQHIFTMFLPSEHRNVPPYITSMVGEPETTIALTNYRRLYRFNMSHDTKYVEIMLGGRFESSISHMQLLAYVHPYLVVTGQPLWYNASTYYKCFGIWNIETQESVLQKVIPSYSHFPPHAHARCGIPSVIDYLHHECLHLSECGQLLYWKCQNTLCKLHLPSYTITSKIAYPAFLYGRITQLVICTVKQWLAVYDADMEVWKLFDLPTGEKLIHVFKYRQKTQLHIYPFQSQFCFSRKMGAKVIVSVVPFEHCIGQSCDTV